MTERGGTERGVFCYDQIRRRFPVSISRTSWTSRTRMRLLTGAFRDQRNVETFNRVDCTIVLPQDKRKHDLSLFLHLPAVLSGIEYF